MTRKRTPRRVRPLTNPLLVALDHASTLTPAERLGFVRVWTKTDFGDLKRTGYDVTIMGRRQNTKMEIKRTHTSLECALADAINEAREMGLGEPS